MDYSKVDFETFQRINEERLKRNILILVQDEIRNSIILVMINLNVITNDQNKSISDYLYKNY